MKKCVHWEVVLLIPQTSTSRRTTGAAGCLVENRNREVCVGVGVGVGL